MNNGQNITRSKKSDKVHYRGGACERSWSGRNFRSPLTPVTAAAPTPLTCSRYVIFELCSDAARKVA